MVLLGKFERFNPIENKITRLIQLNFNCFLVTKLLLLKEKYNGKRES